MAFLSSTVSVGQSTRKSFFDQLLNNTIYLKSETAIFSGHKTFTGATVFIDIQTSTFSIHPQMPGIDSNTSTSGVSIQIPHCYASGTATTMVRLYKKIIEIGDWNMYVTGGGSGTSVKNVAHGIGTYKKIRNVFVIIRNDADVSYHPLNRGTDPTNTTLLAFLHSWDSSNIVLNVLVGGGFDSVSYNSTSYNRGWITIEYEV